MNAAWCRKYAYMGLALIFTCAVPAAQAGDPSPTLWQRVHLSHGDVRYDFPVYANHALDGDLSTIERIVLIQHGILRNGDVYYANGLSLLEASGLDPDKVLLVAPNFPAGEDRSKGFDDMPVWRAGGAYNWAGGEDSIGISQRISSFQVLDDLLLKVTDPKRLPALRRVTLAGHSAGAQMLQRYAILNNADESIRARGVEVRYVIANPSSYLYLTAERARGDSFGPIAGGTCVDFDRYRYGMQGVVAYGSGHDSLELFQRYAKRDVVYLNGTSDDDPNHSELDKRCGAEIEGATRLERGRTYRRYERYLAGSSTPLSHSSFEVSGVGHDQARMFGSQCGQSALFGVASKTGAACSEY